MARKPVSGRLDRTGDLLVFPGVPFLILVAFVLYVVSYTIAEVTGSLADYWTLIPKIWLVVFFGFVIVSLLLKYWILRLASLLTRGKYVSPEAISSGYAVGTPIGVWALMLTLYRSDVPVWLHVIATVAVVLGVAMDVEEWTKLNRIAKGKTKGDPAR